MAGPPGAALKVVDGGPVTSGGGGGGGEDPLVARAVRRVMRHVVPLAMAVLFISNIDRSNLSYAALTFNRDNGFGPKTYATAASLFFATYCVMQVPSNMIMLRVGHRPWVAFIVFGWGAVATCFAAIKAAGPLFALRALMGVLEAGALPAMWHVLAVFIPARRINMPYALLSICPLLSNIIAALLAFGLLAMDGLGGLRGWQWLFMLEGLPAVILGVVVWFFLPSSISTARFLPPDQKTALAAAVDADCAATRPAGGTLALLRRTLSNPYVWTAVLASLMSSIAAQVFLSFTPIIISNLLNGTALSNAASVAAAAGQKSLKPVGLTAIPYVTAAVTALLVSAHAQRRNEQFFHAAASIFTSGALLAFMPLIVAASPAAGFAALCLSLAFGSASNPVMMVLTSRLCLGDEQAAALPLVNSAVVLGGIVGPQVVAAMMNRLGGFTYVFVLMGCLDVAEAAIILGLRFWVTREGGLPDSGRNPRNVRAARRGGGALQASAAAGVGAGGSGKGGAADRLEAAV